MYLDYSDMEAIVSNLLQMFQDNFSATRLFYPDCEALEEESRVKPLIPVPMHINKSFEVSYVLEGDMLLQLDQKVVRLRQGQIFIVPPNVLHYELPNLLYSAKVAWFVIHEDRINITISETRSDGSFYIHCGQKIKMEPITISMATSDIAKELRGQEFGSESLLRCVLLQLMLTVLREMKKQDTRLTASQWRQSIVREVMRYLQNRPGTIPDLDDLANHCAMSPNHLNSIFKSVMGKTITAYCSDLRINQAKYLLEATHLKVRELSEQLGYYDQYHFCKAFKKATGLSPSQYRENCKKPEK